MKVVIIAADTNVTAPQSQHRLRFQSHTKGRWIHTECACSGLDLDVLRSLVVVRSVSATVPGSNKAKHLSKTVNAFERATKYSLCHF
jgi:hypothetical protein